jgi:hypothetical protein
MIDSTKSELSPKDRLDRDRFEIDVELRRKELALREKELDLKAKSDRGAAWRSPLFLALLAAVAGLIGNAIVALVQGRSASELKEREAANNEKIEAEKFRSDMILQVIKTGDTEF